MHSIFTLTAIKVYLRQVYSCILCVYKLDFNVVVALATQLHGTATTVKSCSGIMPSEDIYAVTHSDVLLDSTMK